MSDFSNFTVNLPDLAPTGWTGRITMSFHQHNTGAATRTTFTHPPGLALCVLPAASPQREGRTHAHAAAQSRLHDFVEAEITARFDEDQLGSAEEHGVVGSGVQAGAHRGGQGIDGEVFGRVSGRGVDAADDPRFRQAVPSAGTQVEPVGGAVSGGEAGVAHDTLRFRAFADKAEGRFQSVGSGLRVTDVRASGVSCSSTEPSTCSGSRP
ncbi:hypothetical protein AB0K12_47625 [Nonomuraea sp. NPDC049419]|uniref:hypothetical protein n=1 Tax=Nonomuraea sp. NPDC049419 TaxID=3155772 RepID=UPI003440F43C